MSNINSSKILVDNDNPKKNQNNYIMEKVCNSKNFNNKFYHKFESSNLKFFKLLKHIKKNKKNENKKYLSAIDVISTEIKEKRFKILQEIFENNKTNNNIVLFKADAFDSIVLSLINMNSLDLIFNAFERKSWKLLSFKEFRILKYSNFELFFSYTDVEKIVESSKTLDELKLIHVGGKYTKSKKQALQYEYFKNMDILVVKIFYFGLSYLKGMLLSKNKKQSVSFFNISKICFDDLLIDCSQIIYLLLNLKCFSVNFLECRGPPLNYLKNNLFTETNNNNNNYNNLKNNFNKLIRMININRIFKENITYGNNLTQIHYNSSRINTVFNSFISFYTSNGGFYPFQVFLFMRLCVLRIRRFHDLSQIIPFLFSIQSIKCEFFLGCIFCEISLLISKLFIDYTHCIDDSDDVNDDKFDPNEEERTIKSQIDGMGIVYKNFKFSLDDKTILKSFFPSRDFPSSCSAFVFSRVIWLEGERRLNICSSNNFLYTCQLLAFRIRARSLLLRFKFDINILKNNVDKNYLEDVDILSNYIHIEWYEELKFISFLYYDD